MLCLPKIRTSDVHVHVFDGILINVMYLSVHSTILKIEDYLLLFYRISVTPA